MRLQRLAALLAAGAAVGMLGLGWFAVETWQGLQQSVDEQRRMAQADQQAVRLINALDYVTLLRHDDQVIGHLRTDIRELHDRLREMEVPAAHEASDYLGELEYLVGVVGELDSMHEVSRPLAGQIRVYQSRLLAALQALRDQTNSVFTGTLVRALLVFLAATTVYALLCVASFVWVGYRLRGPLRELGQTVSEIASGRLEARARVRSGDELGELAAHINHMAERRQANERELRESEEKFRQLTENINEVFWLTDPEKRQLLYVSPAYETIWGHSKDELFANPSSWRESIHPDDRARVAEAVKHQAEGRYNELYRIIQPDGSQRWVVDRAFPVRDSRGRVYRIAGLAEDVTERMAADRTLRKRMQELNCLYRVLELTTGEMDQGDVFTRIAGLLPTSLEHARSAVAQVVIDDTTFESPGWREPLTRLDAGIRTEGRLRGTVQVGYVDPHPRSEGGVGPFWKEEQALLEGVALHIGRMLQSRETELRLQRAQRLEAVGQLTGGLAHDFNNLLTVILGNAELLTLMLSEDGDKLETVEMISKAAQRGADLTRGLLAFARRQPLNPQPVDVNELVAGMDALLRRTLGEHFELEFARGGGLWNASADPAQLESALLNLVLNARDAMPEGGRVTIETANVRLGEDYTAAFEDLEPGQYVMVGVSDTGCGMDKEQLARAFEPFFMSSSVCCYTPTLVLSN